MLRLLETVVLKKIARAPDFPVEFVLKRRDELGQAREKVNQNGHSGLVFHFFSFTFCYRDLQSGAAIGSRRLGYAGRDSITRGCHCGNPVCGPVTAATVSLGHPTHTNPADTGCSVQRGSTAGGVGVRQCQFQGSVLRGLSRASNHPWCSVCCHGWWQI